MKHLKAHPTEPAIFPHLCLIILLLSNNMYSSSLWKSDCEEFLFARHFKEELSKLEDIELIELALKSRKIGTHSIRKGANTHGCSLPGQKGNIPMMLHGGWTT
jgi:hypothetical protein